MDSRETNYTEILQDGSRRERSILRLGRRNVDAVNAVPNVVVLQAHTTDSTDPLPTFTPTPRGAEESEAEFRLRIAYEAIGHALEYPDWDVNLTRLHDWLGGGDIDPSRLLVQEQP